MASEGDPSAPDFEAHEVDSPAGAPSGIDWSLLSEDDLDRMPVLRQLRDRNRTS